MNRSYVILKDYLLTVEDSNSLYVTYCRLIALRYYVYYHKLLNKAFTGFLYLWIVVMSGWLGVLLYLSISSTPKFILWLATDVLLSQAFPVLIFKPLTKHISEINLLISALFNAPTSPCSTPEVKKLLESMLEAYPLTIDLVFQQSVNMVTDFLNIQSDGRIQLTKFQISPWRSRLAHALLGDS